MGPNCLRLESSAFGAKIEAPMSQIGVGAGRGVISPLGGLERGHMPSPESVLLFLFGMVP